MSLRVECKPICTQGSVRLGLKIKGLHHRASEGRTLNGRMAGRDGSLDPGGRSRRADDVRADRRDAGAEPESRNGLMKVANRLRASSTEITCLKYLRIMA